MKKKCKFWRQNHKEEKLLGSVDSQQRKNMHMHTILWRREGDAATKAREHRAEPIHETGWRSKPPAATGLRDGSEEQTPFKGRKRPG